MSNTDTRKSSQIEKKKGGQDNKYNRKKNYINVFFPPFKSRELLNISKRSSHETRQNEMVKDDKKNTVKKRKCQNPNSYYEDPY